MTANPVVRVLASGPSRPLILPCAVAAALSGFLLHPGVQRTPGMFWAFVVAVAGILVWTAWLYSAARHRSEGLVLDFVLRTPHWMQTLAQGALLVWWGAFVSLVPAWAPLIIAQLLLAVAVESLFSLTRRGRYSLGLGPVPVVFSVNLFLWFTEPWFFLQFAMIVLVYAGKEFIRWQLDGHSRHIFNPSALALSVAAVILIATGQTDITLGIEIAQSQFIPPQMFLVIFLAAVPAQLLFGVAMMTMPAVLTILGFGLLYQASTGIYFFYDAFLPISVFLGLHLLFTDPATSPRSDGGRVIFGLLYGTGVILSVLLLDAIGAPNFYDKLLPVPILNLLAPRLDRAATFLAARVPAAVGALQRPGGGRRRVATVGIWGACFATMSFTGGIGDNHPGQYYPFWRDACEAGSERACNYTGIMQQNFCDRGSGWACNEFGVLMADMDRDFVGAVGEFERACRLGFGPACRNLEGLAAGDERLARGGAFQRGPPLLQELPIVLRGSKGPVTERDPDALRALGCERGWGELGCG